MLLYKSRNWRRHYEFDLLVFRLEGNGLQLLHRIRLHAEELIDPSKDDAETCDIVSASTPNATPEAGVHLVVHLL